MGRTRDMPSKLTATAPRKRKQSAGLKSCTSGAGPSRARTAQDQAMQVTRPMQTKTLATRLAVERYLIWRRRERGTYTRSCSAMRASRDRRPRGGMACARFCCTKMK